MCDYLLYTNCCSIKDEWISFTQVCHEFLYTSRPWISFMYMYMFACRHYQVCMYWLKLCQVLIIILCSNRGSTRPVWLTSVNSCQTRSSCFADCYSVESLVDLSSRCAHNSDIYITCGMYVLVEEICCITGFMTNDVFICRIFLTTKWWNYFPMHA